MTFGVLMDQDWENGLAMLEGMRDALRGEPRARLLPLPAAQEAMFPKLARTGEIQGLAGAALSDRWINASFPRNFPVVNTINFSHITVVPNIVPDDAKAGEWVARHFIKWGYTHFGVIGDRVTYASRLRCEGFMRAMEEDALVIRPPMANSEMAWRTWCDSWETDLAIFCTSDSLARRFWELRNKLPHSLQRRILAIAGIGDSLQNRVFSGLELTSVRLPFREIGRETAQLLLKGSLSRPQNLVIAPEELVVRTSSGKLFVGDALVSKALELASQDLSHPFGIDELARKAGVSRRTLETRFRAILGRSPASALRERRIIDATRLLDETDLPVAEISARIGCASVQAFTELFKKAKGLPPAEYRNKVGKARRFIGASHNIH